MIAERYDLVQIALTCAVVWVTMSRFLGRVRSFERLKELEAEDPRRELAELPDDPLEAEFLALEAAVVARQGEQISGRETPVD